MINLGLFEILGGPGSGHHGHSGRPGKRGGSSKGGVAKVAPPAKAKGGKAAAKKTTKESAGGTVDYTPQDTTAGVQEELARKGVKAQFKGRDYKMDWDSGGKESVNAAAKELARAIDHFPELTKRLADKKLGLTWHSSGIKTSSGKTLSEDSAAGAYEKSTSTMHISGFAALWRPSNENLAVGGGKNHTVSLSGSGGAVLRHEYGHFVMDRLMKPAERMAWSKLHTSFGRALFGNSVSKYAQANSQEAFAECFSAVTSPQYKSGVKGKSLPGEIEAYFRKWG